jgi:hypothetical protein
MTQRTVDQQTYNFSYDAENCQARSKKYTKSRMSCPLFSR